MAHHYSNSLYDRLADRLNQFPQGAPLSDSLFAILKILFSEKEAGLVAQLPIKPFTVDRAAAIWKLDKATASRDGPCCSTWSKTASRCSACPRQWPGSLNFP